VPTALYDHLEDAHVEIDVGVCDFVEGLYIVVVLLGYWLDRALFVVGCLLVGLPAFLGQGWSSEVEITAGIKGISVVKSVGFDDSGSLYDFSWDPNEVIAEFLYIGGIGRISDTGEIPRSSFLLRCFHVEAGSLCQFGEEVDLYEIDEDDLGGIEHEFYDEDGVEFELDVGSGFI
jgi:hypothetical protein